MRLYLVRHAKSDHPSGVSDRERPLARRGIDDASAIGAFLAERGLIPTTVIASPATRAAETARLIVAEANPPRQVTIDDSLYGGGVGAMLQAASGHDEVMLVGHEPTMSMTVEALCGGEGGMVTTAVACIEVYGRLPGTSGTGVLRWMLTPGLVRGTNP